MELVNMLKPFCHATCVVAPQAAVLFYKFHIMKYWGEALDKIRKTEYARCSNSEGLTTGYEYSGDARNSNHA